MCKKTSKTFRTLLRSSDPGQWSTMWTPDPNKPIQLSACLGESHGLRNSTFFGLRFLPTFLTHFVINMSTRQNHYKQKLDYYKNFHKGCALSIEWGRTAYWTPEPNAPVWAIAPSGGVACIRKSQNKFIHFLCTHERKRNNAQHSKQGSTNDDENAKWRYEEQQVLGVVRAVSPAHDQRRWTQQPAVIHERNDDQMWNKDVNKWQKKKHQTNSNKM